MEKLLCERLRDLADGVDCDEPRKELKYEIDDEQGKRKCSWCSKAALEAIADEIERYYIPRPRFEDGEPVQFGDKFLRWDGKNGNDGENVTEIAVQSGDHYRWSLNGDCCTSQFVARPTPKVYDADVVEIKVGDTVWCIDDEPERKWRVEEIHADKPLIHLYELDAIGDHSWGWVSAERFAHERPVFDADGVRVCKGDTVWGILLHDKHEVSLVKNGFVYLDDGSICFEPTQLTHKEPDSLEKLRDDIAKKVQSLNAISIGEMELWADRITAIIERSE